jgi:hypothetical protein
MDQIKSIRCWLIFFIIGLLISGITAFPLLWELEILNNLAGTGSSVEKSFPQLSEWITKVYLGLKETYSRYPFIAYGTDWLAFAHIILAILFIGPYVNPEKNIWVIEFGIISCLLVFPLAFICGLIRGIPFFWILIDCSFGAIGIIPLLVVRAKIKKL